MEPYHVREQHSVMTLRAFVLVGVSREARMLVGAMRAGETWGHSPRPAPLLIGNPLERFVEGTRLIDLHRVADDIAHRVVVRAKRGTDVLQRKDGRVKHRTSRQN